MKTEQLLQVLDADRAVRKEGKGTYVVEDDVELTLMVDMGHEVLSVSRVRRLQLQPDLLTVETHKGERIYLGADTTVRGLKFTEPEGRKLPSTGFMR
ncbi:MAG: hypothetical protein RMK29_20400 [Myxococcales bacterium]|nr:hypothetical protein [Myxococcota bacterium]MDW8284072.1 hypothetical protein [Myxococcales bacterium]